MSAAVGAICQAGQGGRQHQHAAAAAAVKFMFPPPPSQAGGGGFQGFNHNQGQPSLSFPDMYGGAHSHLIQHHHTGIKWLTQALLFKISLEN